MGRAFYNGSAHVAGNRSYRYKSGHFFRNKPSMQTMSPNHTPDTPSVFQLKGSMLAITVLELARNDLEALDRQLAAKVAQAPNFFSNTPLVLALDKLPAGEGAVDLPGLMRICRHHGLRTLAIRANRIEDIAAAIAIERSLIRSAY